MSLLVIWVPPGALISVFRRAEERDSSLSLHLAVEREKDGRRKKAMRQKTKGMGEIG